MIRNARLDDAGMMAVIFNQNLSALVPDNNPQAIALLCSGHNEATFVERILDARWCCKVYENVNAECEGFICVRLPQHVFSLYVTPTRHGHGLGAQLFDHIQQELKVDSFTVNSSLRSIGFYQKLGFIAQGECQTQNGVKFIPMSKLR